jgi:hypothetical protein
MTRLARLPLCVASPASQCGPGSIAAYPRSREFARAVQAAAGGQDRDRQRADDYQQQVFGTGFGFPLGQKGIYVMWRNGATVIDPAAFRVLVAG